MSSSDPGLGPDLASLFATNAQDLEAVRVFVDRDDQREAFDGAVRLHWAQTCQSAFDVQDMLAPRRNVLMFYGVGGVGKTALSRALEIRHSGAENAGLSRWPDSDVDFGESVTVRLDLASEAGVEMETVLLAIRASIAKLGRPMHAFDIALSRYWDRVHPNESIADFLRSSGVVSRAADSLQLPDQVKEGLKEVGAAFGLSSTLLSVASQLVVSVGGGLRKHRAKRHAIQECRRLPALLEAEPDIDGLSYYAHLLSWDLDELGKHRDGRFHVVVFVDTFEDIGRGEQRRFERLFNRLVWLMPNVLFVVFGRNRLDWGDLAAEGQLNFSGPIAWPGLVPGAVNEPRQHLLGFLSEHDAERFLSSRLRRGDAAAIPQELRARIAEDSRGYPLYLDLAVTRYLQLAGAGAGPEPTPDDFSGGFPALVTRVLRDLSGDERLLLRILSLLDSFDAELAASIAGLPSEAIARQLAQRSFVSVDDEAPFPYSIHRLLRDEIRRSDTGGDAFSPADWARYAQRAFDEVGARYRTASAAHDRIVVISALNQALRLADEFQLGLGWCTDAAYSFVEDSLWESSLRPLVPANPTTPAAALAHALLAIVNRQTDGRQTTARILGDVLTTGLLAGDAGDLALYYAAESLRETGRGEQSETLLRELVARDSRMRVPAVKGLVHRLRRLGRFRETLELIEAQPVHGTWLQLRGTLLWSQGVPEEAKAFYASARDWFTAMGSPGHSAEVDGCLAFVGGLTGGVEPQDRALVDAGLASLADSRNTWARLLARLGEVLLTADGGAATAARLQELVEEGVASGLTSIQAYAYFGLCLNAALSDDTELLLLARSGFASWVTGDDFRSLVEVVDFWIDPAPAGWESYAVADWLGGVDRARERWRALLAARRLG